MTFFAEIPHMVKLTYLTLNVFEMFLFFFAKHGINTPQGREIY